MAFVAQLRTCIVSCTHIVDCRPESKDQLDRSALDKSEGYSDIAFWSTCQQGQKVQSAF